MSKATLLALTGAATLGLAACGEAEAPKSQAAAPTTPPAQTQTVAPASTQPTQPQPSLLEKAMETAKGARQATVEEATRAVEAARASADAAIDRGREAADRAAERGKTLGQATLQQGMAIAALTAEKTESLIRQAQDAIDRNRPEVAREIADRLHKVKESLPQGVRDKLDRLDARLASRQPIPPEEAAAPPSY